jgi:[ribosomal protein S18]-alanine N-acetyltransferase
LRHAQAVNELIIRPLRDENEARACAALIAETEPWKTIKFSVEQILQRLTHAQREVFVAEFQGEIAGALVLHLDGALNGYIQTIVVFEKFQCRGFGKKLMRFAEEKIFRQSPNVFCASRISTNTRKNFTRNSATKKSANWKIICKPA